MGIAPEAAHGFAGGPAVEPGLEAATEQLGCEAVQAGEMLDLVVEQRTSIDGDADDDLADKIAQQDLDRHDGRADLVVDDLPAVFRPHALIELEHLARPCMPGAVGADRLALGAGGDLAGEERLEGIGDHHLSAFLAARTRSPKVFMTVCHSLDFTSASQA